MTENYSVRICKTCPSCNRRLFDKITPTQGFIEIKCPNCKRIVRVNLSLRRAIKRRVA